MNVLPVRVQQYSQYAADDSAKKSELELELGRAKTTTKNTGL